MKKNVSRIVTCLLLIATLLPFSAVRTPIFAQGAAPGDIQETPPAADPGGVSATDADWWAQAQAGIQAAEYAVTWQENLPQQVGLAGSDMIAAYQAPNRGQDFRIYFLPGGIRVVPRGWAGEAEPTWQFGLSLTGAATAELAPEGNQVAYLRPEGVAEWYRNEPTGLVQGLEIVVGAEEQAVVSVTVDTDLVPILAEDGQSVDFVDAITGAAVLRYGAVSALDAAGLDLPITLALAEAGPTATLRIAISATVAVYPLAVTAMLTSLAAPDAVEGMGANPAWSAESNQADAGFGLSVATAGDVNGDGYSDVIIGAPKYDNGQNNEGRAYVFLGSANGLGASPAWTAESNQADAWFGLSVATAGDVNGDGYSDVIIGAPYYDNGQNEEGRVYVFHGSASGLAPNPAWTAESNQANAYFGTSVAVAGDVNGDGYADIIVGSPRYSNGQANEGRAFIYHGSASGLGASAAWTAESNQEDSGFGQSVATAGDVDGDGYADVIIGAPGYRFGQINEGRAYVYRGGASGVSGNPILTAESNQAEANLGASVATAGDVNGDGYADVIVGAPKYDNGQTDEGRVFLYLGYPGTLNANAAWTAESNQRAAYFGSSVATAGDVNGDGYADVIVGAHFYTNGQEYEGRAFIYLGSASGLKADAAWTAESNQAIANFGGSVATAGDVNGDGYSDVIVGAAGYDNGQTDEGRVFVYYGAADGLGADPAWTVEGNQVGARFGWSVAPAGDVNGDGYADVIVSASANDNREDSKRRVYVYHGGPKGLSNSPAWTAVGGDQPDTHFGRSVASAGDVNGDGYADVIVGAPKYEYLQTDKGRAYVYHGGPDGLSPSPAWTAKGDVPGGFFGLAVAPAGDVNGDGYADVIVGGYWVSVYHGGPGGLSANRAWAAQMDGIRFGESVATAGDVNGDGYSDIIVGAPGYYNAGPAAGRAYVYHGGVSGLSLLPVWRSPSAGTGFEVGRSVATAGDVNGDGYADVIVGAPGGYPDSYVSVFYGSASGLSAAEDWRAKGVVGPGFGLSVATAGDVNGDGYADVIVGELPQHPEELPSGRAYVYHGGPRGLGSTADWKTASNQRWLGRSVASAGDINGDGYADVIVGADLYSGDQATEGRALVFYGNGGGLSVSPRQRRANDSAPIAPGGSSERQAFTLALNGRTPFGSGRVKLEWEVKPLGVLFNGRGTAVSANWMKTGAAGAALSELISGLAANTPYHWRVRVRYHPGTTPFQQYSRWITIPWNGWNETDLRTATGRKVFLPSVRR